MKRYFIGAIAVCAAIVSFAFTKEGNKLVPCNTTTQYVWYEVLGAQAIPCANYATVVASQLDIAPHTAFGTTNPLADNNTAGFRLVKGNLSTPGTAINFFTCPEDLTYVCAVAYDPADVTTLKFNRIEFPVGSGNFVWSPKTDANKPIPVCSICRNEQ